VIDSGTESQRPLLVIRGPFRPHRPFSSIISPLWPNSLLEAIEALRALQGSMAFLKLQGPFKALCTFLRPCTTPFRPYDRLSGHGADSEAPRETSGFQGKL